jgi:hypothetical protein
MVHPVIVLTPQHPEQRAQLAADFARARLTRPPDPPA